MRWELLPHTGNKSQRMDGQPNPDRPISPPFVTRCHQRTAP